MAQFSTRAPEVLSTSELFSFAIPVINTGPETMRNLTLTSVKFGSALAMGPALPFPLGDLAADNVTTLSASFATGGLVAGGRYLASLRGTYDVGGERLGFALNRFIDVPPPFPPPVEFLLAHVRVSIDPNSGTWLYALSNDEPAGSPLYINAFSLDMAAPFEVTGTPPGWEVETDNASYAFWYSADEAPPYPTHIAPGAWLGGFQIQCNRRTSQGRAFIITSWNHAVDDAGLTTPGTVLTPSQT